MRVQIINQFAAFAPRHAGAGSGDGGDALVDFQGQRLRAHFGRQFEPKPALQIGVPRGRLDQQLRQAGRSETNEAGGRQPGRDPWFSRHDVFQWRRRFAVCAVSTTSAPAPLLRKEGRRVCPGTHDASLS